MGGKIGEGRSMKGRGMKSEGLNGVIMRNGSGGRFR